MGEPFGSLFFMSWNLHCLSRWCSVDSLPPSLTPSRAGSLPQGSVLSARSVS